MVGVDENASFADLKATLTDFLRRFFERDDLQVLSARLFSRLPEPSASLIKGERGWLEVGGRAWCIPTLRNVNIDPKPYRLRVWDWL